MIVIPTLACLQNLTYQRLKEPKAYEIRCQSNHTRKCPIYQFKIHWQLHSINIRLKPFIFQNNSCFKDSPVSLLCGQAALTYLVGSASTSNARSAVQKFAAGKAEMIKGSLNITFNKNRCKSSFTEKHKNM